MYRVSYLLLYLLMTYYLHELSDLSCDKTEVTLITLTINHLSAHNINTKSIHFDLNKINLKNSIQIFCAGEESERLTDEEANELLRECRPIYPKIINPETQKGDNELNKNSLKFT